MVDIEVKILKEKQKRIINKLKTISKKVENPRALYARWGVQGLRWIDENFKRQGELLAEGKWKDISPVTKARRRKGKREGHGRFGDKILMDTGRLKQSFTTRFSYRGVYLGTETEYASTHEYGYKNIPKRRILPQQKDKTMMKILLKTTKNYIKQISK